MKPLRRLALLSVVMCLPALVHAEGVLKVNGEAIDKALVRITASERNIVVTFDDGSQAAYPMNSSVVDFTGGAGIAALSKSQFYVARTVVPDQLQVEGLEAGDRLAVYSANGQLVSKATAEGTSHVVNVAGMAHGVYILRVNNTSVKFIKE